MPWYRRIFFALVALAILQTVYYFPQMPDVIASHFDGGGAPNAWSGRIGFFGLYLAMIALLILVFVLVPKWTERRINFAKNIPNHEYWLAPERIAETRAYFRAQMMQMGVLHLLLAVFVMELAIRANFATPPRIDDSIYAALLLYFVLLIAWLIRFYRHFRKT